jgi:hypothetical protein
MFLDVSASVHIQHHGLILEQPSHGKMMLDILE